jgi:hypothetical protein
LQEPIEWQEACSLALASGFEFEPDLENFVNQSGRSEIYHLHCNSIFATIFIHIHWHDEILEPGTSAMRIELKRPNSVIGGETERDLGIWPRVVT